SLEVHQKKGARSKDFASFLFARKGLHIFCTSLAHFPDFKGYPCILCTARFLLHKKKIFQANNNRTSSRRSSGFICRTASRITEPVMFVASGFLFSSGPLRSEPDMSCL